MPLKKIEDAKQMKPDENPEGIKELKELSPPDPPILFEATAQEQNEIPNKDHIYLPVVALRGTVFFPGSSMSFEVSRKESADSVREAMKSDRRVILCSQVDPLDDKRKTLSLFRVGTVVNILQVLEVGENHLKVMCDGMYRGRVHRIIDQDKVLYAEISRVRSRSIPKDADLKVEAMRREILSRFEQLAMITGMIAPETVALAATVMKANELCDLVLLNLGISLEERQAQLEETNTLRRLENLLYLLGREIEIAQLTQRISVKVHEAMDQNQKEYFLREQVRMIQEELGEMEATDSDQFRTMLKESGIPEEYKEKVLKEIERFSRMPATFPESNVQRSWLELLFELPFGKIQKEHLDLGDARKILDREHYGMKKVKERILEYVAVRSLQVKSGDSSVRGPILCFVGPPGVGKTSIAKSIAEALGRRYIRMSLGGVTDEAEIRGHRRTYVGAMPGRILAALRQCGVDNPLFLLDEVDKLGSDFRGDPSSALLEVLDPEQNNNFRDHYIEMPYDLSKVLFVTTANSAWQIPEPLLDRMELIELAGYTEEEKFEIAKRHILPRQIKEHALGKSQLKITPAALKQLISSYTSEAGVRQLEREIAHLCRRVAMRLSDEGLTQVRVGVEDLEPMLGRRKYLFDKAENKERVGCVTGLAWTAVGGDTLTIEVNVMKGSGKMELTGHLGEVMKESARAALTYIRSRAQELGLNDHFANDCDIHIHVPAGAVPKDGPSAGITLAAALASALTGRPVRRDLAMTGEITLRGRVLAIGGLKEKAVAARRAGVREILIPKENVPDIEDIPDSVLESLKITTVTTMDEVLKSSLLPEIRVQTPATLEADREAEKAMKAAEQAEK